MDSIRDTSTENQYQTKTLSFSGLNIWTIRNPTIINVKVTGFFIHGTKKNTLSVSTL